MTALDFKTYISELALNAQKIMEAYDDVIRDLEANTEMNTAYVEYGVKMRSNHSSSVFGAYDPNPARDRYVGNVKRGKITKRPKDPLKSPYVYYHDADGALLCVEGRWESCPSRARKRFLLYDGCQCWVISRLYESELPIMNDYNEVHHVQFKNGHVSSVSYISGLGQAYCHAESAFFEYDPNNEYMVITEFHYNFHDFWDMDEYIFQCDTPGNFVTYQSYEDGSTLQQEKNGETNDAFAGSSVRETKRYNGTWKCIPPITQEELDDPRCMFPCWKASLTMQDR